MREQVNSKTGSCGEIDGSCTAEDRDFKDRRDFYMINEEEIVKSRVLSEIQSSDVEERVLKVTGKVPQRKR